MSFLGHDHHINKFNILSTMLFFGCFLLGPQLLSTGKLWAFDDQDLEYFQQNKKCSGCDLTGVNLASLYFEEDDLIGADLSGSNLENADLSWANLTRANLSSANLSHSVLRLTNLTEATLQKANFFEADLTGANLERANLKQATLEYANLTEVNLTMSNLQESLLNFSF